MNILVFEYVSGGGLESRPVFKTLLPEGFAMLQAVISDFQLANHQIFTILDAQISRSVLPSSVNVTSITKSEQLPEVIDEIIPNCDLAIVIAPESKETLASLVNQISLTGCPIINSSVSAIRKVSKKGDFIRDLQRLGFPVPATIQFSKGERYQQYAAIKELGFPLVIKPVDGAGGVGLFLIKSTIELTRILDMLEHYSSNQWLAQEYIVGTAVSVSLLTNGESAFALALNQQFIQFGDTSKPGEYIGGISPYFHRFQSEAYTLCGKIVKKIPGFQGYIGVDLVLTPEKAIIMEINPRITTSYLGIREIIIENLGELMIQAVTTKQLPSRIDYEGFASYRKTHILDHQKKEGIPKGIDIISDVTYESVYNKLVRN